MRVSEFDFLRGTFWILVSIFCGTVHLQARPSLSCEDFKSVLSFVEQQHLRFQYLKPGEKAGLFSAAEKDAAKQIASLGFPMLSANYEHSVFPKISKIKSEEVLCESLESTLFRAAFLKSYIRSMDPYSDFYVSEEVDIKSSALDGEFIGVGIATEPKENTLEVTEVLAGGPADQKLFAGDRISEIDHHSVIGLSEIEVRQRIRGSIGSIVNFSGKRGKSPFSVMITRNKVHQQSVGAHWLDGGILMIKIQKFYRQTAQEVENIMRTESSKAKGIILDLRNNPGGLLQGARDVVDLFISQGVVVYLKGKVTEDQIWALREGSYSEKPLVILINEGTASAAEIVAGALQDYGRAVLVGQKTYGKGSVQNIYESQTALGIKYKGGLKLTTLWYYLPSGRSVKSLTPDVLIPLAKGAVPVTHPKMPYKGANKIEVLPLQTHQSSNKKALNSRKMEAILKKSPTSEEAGRALLLELTSQFSSSERR